MVTRMDVEVLVTPTIDSTGYSSILGALFWGMEWIFGWTISTRLWAVPIYINTQTLNTLHVWKMKQTIKH